MIEDQNLQSPGGGLGEKGKGLRSFLKKFGIGGQSTPVEQNAGTNPLLTAEEPIEDTGIIPVTRELRAEDLASLDADRIPHGYLCAVVSKSGEKVHQTLTPADPEPSGLADFGQKTIAEIQEKLQKANIAFLYAPSRAGKSEAILAGFPRYFPMEQILEGKTNGVFLDLQTIGLESCTKEQIEANVALTKERLTEEGKKKVLIIDEFQTNENTLAFIEKMAEDPDLKIVITY